MGAFRGGVCVLVTMLPLAAWAAEARPLVAALGGPDAVAEMRAMQELARMGDAAVPALAEAALSGKTYPARMIAVELLGRTGTPAAMDALIAQLRQEKHLAVRGQICMQLGYNRERRAAPVIAEWLKTIGPRALDDVRGPKEILPSTCYLRHVEALGMIGDESALPVLEEFESKIPKGIGFGGFISNFVAGGVDEAKREIAEKAAFRNGLKKQAGLEKSADALFAHFRADPVARYRLHEDEVLRHTPRGREILQETASGKNATVAAAAKQVLEAWDQLGN